MELASGDWLGISYTVWALIFLYACANYLGHIAKRVKQIAKKMDALEKWEE